MARLAARAVKWVGDAIHELTSDLFGIRSPVPARHKRATAPPAASRCDIQRQDDVSPAVMVAHGPKRNQMPLPPRGPQTVRACKAVDTSKKAVIRLFEDVRLGRPVEVGQLGPIVASLSREIEENATALLEVLRLKNKSEYTYLHPVAVSAMMLLLGRAMGYRGAELTDLGLAGLLHDVGKMGVPSHILEKPGPLTEIEFASVKAHPSLGHTMLASVPGLPDVARTVCLFHHEKIDGSGYPFGHRKEEIGVAARMGAICDVYDALTSDRAYKDAWSPDKALRLMREWSGHFDQDILAVFMQSLGIYPVGSLVSVKGNSLGIVLSDNPKAPTRPVVRTFYSIPRKCHVAHEDVAIGCDGILSIEDPTAWPFDDWASLSVDLLQEGRFGSD